MQMLCLVIQLCLSLCDPMDPMWPHHVPVSMGILEACILELCSHALLQRIFPIQGLNSGLSHCRWIVYYLNSWEVSVKSEESYSWELLRETKLSQKCTSKATRLAKDLLYIFKKGWVLDLLWHMHFCKCYITSKRQKWKKKKTTVMIFYCSTQEMAVTLQI